jgi:trehalose-phosphatase
MDGDRAAMWAELARRDPLALFLDFDGTLIPLASTPAEALPGAEVLSILHALCGADGVTCAVVSGRPRGSMDEMFARVPGLLLVAEHGMWRRAGGEWEASAAVDGGALDHLESLVAGRVLARPGALLERKTSSVCVHYRLVGGRDREDFLAAIRELLLDWLAAQPDFELLDVVQAMEVRARAVHKGHAVTWARERAGRELACVAAGDDVTDEDIFAALGPGDAAILVGEERARTAARWRLDDPRAVHRFLRGLLELRRGGPVDPQILPAPIAPRHG